MPRTTWMLCLSKKKGLRKVEVKILRATAMPEKGEGVQVVAQFPRKVSIEEVRERYTDAFLRTQWRTMFFIHGRDTYPEHMKR